MSLQSGEIDHAVTLLQLVLALLSRCTLEEKEQRLPPPPPPPLPAAALKRIEKRKRKRQNAKLRRHSAEAALTDVEQQHETSQRPIQVYPLVEHLLPAPAPSALALCRKCDLMADNVDTSGMCGYCQSRRDSIQTHVDNTQDGTSSEDSKYWNNLHRSLNIPSFTKAFSTLLDSTTRELLLSEARVAFGEHQPYWRPTPLPSPPL